MIFRLVEDFLFESKEDVQRFVDKFGQEAYDRLQNNKQRIKTDRKDPKYVDITWLTKNVSKDELENLLAGSESKELDIEGRAIPKPTNTKKRLKDYELDGWKIYLVTDYEDMIDIGRDTGWCIAGRYVEDDEEPLKDGEVKVSQAKKYFNEYMDKYDLDSYCVLVSPTGDKYCVLANDSGVVSVWDKNDMEVYEYDFVKILPVDLVMFFGLSDWSRMEYPFDWGYSTDEIPSDVTVLYLESPETKWKIEDLDFAYLRKLWKVYIPSEIKSIGSGAFLHTSLTDVYYDGTKNKWNKIKIDSDNRDLFGATIHCNDGDIKYSN